ncbi:ATP-binding protein [Noviherbaspirillum pedocola]|uniref:ATP-binding protein n=1 Tax=Noviherbaspirillum pedocola TaxID=2801341 RepID=A0A934SY94_9BURK|nr:ATP-binding protein [Noviherbaspirillum pedocola]MBK4738765.1 ATP-binding protein [Noviherbaspirillum pedocola]
MESGQRHFPRPAIAAQHIATFRRGLISSRVMFARRQMGKTTYLLQDLAPAAQEAGYRVAYVDVSQSPDPGHALAEAIRGAVKRSRMAWLTNRLPVPAAWRHDGKIALTDALLMANRQSCPILLLVDEAQTLSLPAHENLAYALRALLDVRRNEVKALFAGTADKAQPRRFGLAGDPFFQWAYAEQFPVLGPEFVEFVVSSFKRSGSHPLPLESALHAFTHLHARPGAFGHFVACYMARNDGDVEAALTITIRHEAARATPYRSGA